MSQDADRGSGAGRAVESDERAAAGVLAPPPVLYGTGLIVGLVLHLLHPIHIAPSAGGVLRGVGIALVVVGLLLSTTVMRVFGAAGTPVPPYRPTRRLVFDGPYRFSRNPDYIGQALVYVGVALLANSWWPLFIFPLVLFVVQRFVIEREERYLEGKFGEEYREYRARVRRWL
jgi:protein-S-isoprenylcysteine O-methyltransferase Ste14